MEYPISYCNGECVKDVSAGLGAIMRDIAIGLSKKDNKVFGVKTKLTQEFTAKKVILTIQILI